MNDIELIKQNLHEQSLPVYEIEIPYIQNTLFLIKQAKAPLKTFPYLNTEVPITVVDKELLR